MDALSNTVSQEKIVDFGMSRSLFQGSASRILLLFEQTERESRVGSGLGGAR